MTLLFYNRNQGKGEFYNIIDAQGNIELLKSYAGWRKSWTHIVYSFSPSLLFYDRSGGDVDEDIEFLTGESAIKSHGAYFKRTSFYHLMRDHLERRLL